MPSITSLGSWITRLGRGLFQLKDSLRLPCTTVISTCAVLRNHLEGLQLTMGNIVNSVFAPLILTGDTTSTEAHEVDLSRLPGAYPSTPSVCTSTTSTITNTTATHTACAVEHGDWAIYNRESKPWKTEVKPSYPVDWNSRIFPMLAAAAVHNTISTVLNVEENLPVAPTIRVLKPSATCTITTAPPRPLQSCKLTFERSVWCKEPRNAAPPGKKSLNPNSFRWVPYARRKSPSALSSVVQTPPILLPPPAQFSKLAGIPSGPFPGLKRLKMSIRLARRRRVLWAEKTENLPMEMELDAIGAGSVSVIGDGDCEMSDDCAVGMQEGDTDMADCSLAPEVVSPPAQVVSPPAQVVVSAPVELKEVKDQPVAEPSSNEDEFDDDLPPAEEISLPPIRAGVSAPVEVKEVKDQPVVEPSSNEDEFDDDLPPAEEISLPEKGLLGC